HPLRHRGAILFWSKNPVTQGWLHIANARHSCFALKHCHKLIALSPNEGINDAANLSVTPNHNRYPSVRCLDLRRKPCQKTPIFLKRKRQQPKQEPTPPSIITNPQTSPLFILLFYYFCKKTRKQPWLLACLTSLFHGFPFVGQIHPMRRQTKRNNACTLQNCRLNGNINFFFTQVGLMD